MSSTENYELRFESDDKTTVVSTMVDGTLEQAVARAHDVANRRKASNMTGRHVLICPDGRQIPID